MSLLLLRPVRCRKCSARFYRFRYSWAKLVVPLTILTMLCGFVIGLNSLRERRRPAVTMSSDPRFNSVDTNKLATPVLPDVH